MQSDPYMCCRYVLQRRRILPTKDRNVFHAYVCGSNQRQNEYHHLPWQQDSCRHEKRTVAPYSIDHPVVSFSLLFLVPEFAFCSGVWVETLFAMESCVVVVLFFIFILVFLVIIVRVLVLTILEVIIVIISAMWS